MRGLGNVYKRGEVYWVRYHHRGRELRESSRSTERANAVALLKRRLADLGQGRPGGLDEERVTFEALAADYIQDRVVRGVPASGVAWARQRVANLSTVFAGLRAPEITTPKMREYAQDRLARKASHGTINRDLGALSRMFTLAIQAGRLSRRPHIPRMTESQPRQGFMEPADYQAIRKCLPAEYKDVLDFGYYSGWRRGEILSLEWRDVDRPAGVIRLRPEVSKTREGRVLVLSAPLRTLIDQRWQARAIGCPYVFHESGRPLENIKRVWRRACKAAGLPSKLFHDLRRTAVRNMVRAGIPERVAMQMSGHKTRSVFDRYNIVSEADLRQAADRLASYIERHHSGQGHAASFLA
jgi:integrase